MVGYICVPSITAIYTTALSTTYVGVCVMCDMTILSEVSTSVIEDTRRGRGKGER